MREFQVYKNLKIIVTGSTGFKGSWLCFWLNSINAKVVGIALRPEKGSILFNKLALNKKISKIITFTGHDKDNPLSKLGDISFWINSKAYNFVENTHQIWLLAICDLIIGKREYLPN